jgi:hypothetical protein
MAEVLEERLSINNMLKVPAILVTLGHSGEERDTKA